MQDDRSSSDEVSSQVLHVIPLGGNVLSARGGTSKSLLHPGAGKSVSLHDLLDVLFLFTLQDTHEVLQLRHGEGVPLHRAKQ